MEDTINRAVGIIKQSDLSVTQRLVELGEIHPDPATREGAIIQAEHRVRTQILRDNRTIFEQILHSSGDR